MTRAKNFNPGPATLPLAALARAQRELLDFEGTGMSILEHSHRGKAYSAVHEEALTLTRELLSIPDDYEVLLLQGGASQQFAVVPLNLLAPDRSADYVLTGVWSLKAIKEAGRVGKTRIAASTEQDGRFTRVPTSSEIEIDPAASYLHLTSNNTIYGTQFFDFPDTGRVPLVADMSSDLMWRPIDVSKFGLIYAGAQKNLGPSGLTLVIVRKDLIEAGRRDIPVIFQYRTHAETQSLYNTIPTFAVYL
ncbi:MAG TPA: 3-phosphoserine/phosphohydroxythreonine transaminase, partial [Polyangiaceae bacterium]|nr:3-phosphoserine/phosphohydroxythreonine transaminase [Polyangiaceae bacterium]